MTTRDAVDEPTVGDGSVQDAEGGGLGRAGTRPRGRRRRARRLVGILLGTLLVAAGIAFLCYRQAVRPLQLNFDDNATGDITPINTAQSQEGQWYAPYRGPRTHFMLAIEFWDNGPWAVRLDKVELSGFNTSEGRVTYNTSYHYDQGIAPAGDRRPLDATLVGPRSPLTVAVPLRYACNLGGPRAA